MPTVEEQIAAINARLDVMEENNAATAEQLREAIEGHPVVTEFRDFLKRWGNANG